MHTIYLRIIYTCCLLTPIWYNDTMVICQLLVHALIQHITIKIIYTILSFIDQGMNCNKHVRNFWFVILAKCNTMVHHISCIERQLRLPCRDRSCQPMFISSMLPSFIHVSWYLISISTNKTILRTSDGFNLLFLFQSLSEPS